MIILKDQKPFANGSHRACYRHPDRPDLCVKVMTEDWTENKRWAKVPWYLRLFRSKSHFHENLHELRFSEKLRKRIGNQDWDHVPQSHELVETDLGEALTVDLIRNHDNTIAITLAEYLWHNGLTPQSRKAIDEMWEDFQKNLIFTTGRPDNVAISIKADGSCQCYAIDALGLHSIIPFVMLIPAKARQKFRKLRAKQELRIQELLEKRERESPEQQKGFKQHADSD
jgi:hypothetical protein